VRALGAAIIVVGVLGGDASAHRLDEYLQATRVSFARDRLAIDVDLTPGISIASSVIAMLDTNADGAVAPAEADGYGRAVLSDLRISLDGNRVGMTLEGIDIPTLDEMRNGTGTIRLRAAGRVEVGAGRHLVEIINNHRPETSVYMVNALVPEDSGIDLVSQNRDPRQREFRAEYDVTSELVGYVMFLGLGTAAVVLAARRRNEKRKANNEKGIGRTV
jgi:hypothetical protein